MAIQKNDFDSRIDFGNLESNMRFLIETDVLNKTQKILEIGSGVGRILNMLYTQGYDIRGVETNKAMVEKCRTLYGENFPLIQFVGVQLPFKDNTFDVVLSFDVLEHIPDSDMHLREVCRVLKDKGYYLLQTPNKFTNTLFETLRWKSFTKWRKVHCSLHSHWQLRKRFQQHNFDIKFYDIPVVNKFFKKKVHRYLGNFGIFLLKIINPDRFPMLLRTDFYIETQKR